MRTFDLRVLGDISIEECLSDMTILTYRYEIIPMDFRLHVSLIGNS